MRSPVFWKTGRKRILVYCTYLKEPSYIGYMRTVVLHLPANIDLDERQTARFLAAKLYESGKLSLGHAAELAGLSKVAFAEILGDFNVSLFNYPASEIGRDAAAI
ncbi:UPF0175 family protein [Rufibacter ruber]|uniref:UPF0175 family protein n=1 Tax=Rufibacter ruber TaxID=1783499 RepID=UPI000A6844E5|nr:UPF0175 family protein [Rufibacter ruber]